MKKAQRLAELEVRLGQLEDIINGKLATEADEMCEPPDHEADFQSFMDAYDMPKRLTRLLRLAYLCGVADGNMPEM